MRTFGMMAGFLLLAGLVWIAMPAALRCKVDRAVRLLAGALLALGTLLLLWHAVR